MMPVRAPAVAKALAALFTGLWWWVAAGSAVLAALVPLGLNVGVQIEPHGEPNFVAGRAAQMVLPVAFELDAGAARVTSADQRTSGTIEQSVGSAVPVRDRQPFAARNAMRIRRLALAVVLAEVSRAALVYAAQACVAAQFSADHLRFTAAPRLNGFALVSGLILLAGTWTSRVCRPVLAEVFRTGTRLDEDQSLTV